MTNTIEIGYKLLTPTAKPPEMAFSNSANTMCFDVFTDKDVHLLAPVKAVHPQTVEADDLFIHLYNLVVPDNGNQPYYIFTGNANHPHPSALPYANITTGIALDLPPGVHVSWGGRSGLAFKKGQIAFEGKIDANYRGELALKIWSMNLDDNGLFIPAGTKMGQLEIVHYQNKYVMKQVDVLDETERGTAGFGSTGS